MEIRNLGYNPLQHSTPLKFINFIQQINSWKNPPRVWFGGTDRI